MPDDNQNPTPTPAPAPASEGFLHSLATSLGLDPEAIRDTTKAVLANPRVALSELGGETSDELKQAAQNWENTATQTGQGLVDTITNPDAQKVAKQRWNKPGVMNKVAGAEEYLTSGVPLVGGNLVKAEEQGAQGNAAGAAGTTIGTVAPMLEGAAKPAPEEFQPYRPINFDAAGGKQIAPPKPRGIEEPPAHVTTPVEPQYAQTLGSRGQLPGQTVDLSPAYGDTGRYVGHQLEARKALTVPEKKQAYISKLGNTTGTAPIDIPQHMLEGGQTTPAIVSHELGHILELDRQAANWDTGADKQPLEIYSHMHPDAEGATAAVPMPWAEVPGTRINPATGNYGFDAESLKSVLPDLIHINAAGGVMANLTHDIPTAAGAGGDIEETFRMAKAAGFTPEETRNMIKAAQANLQKEWNRPEILDLIRGATAGREEGLSKTLHMSADRVQAIRDQVRQLREEAPNGQENSNAAAGAGASAPVAATTGAAEAGRGAEGGVRESNGTAVSANAATQPSLSNKLIAKFGISKNPTETGFILNDGRKVGLGPTEHEVALAVADGRKPTAGTDRINNLTNFINDENAIRMRTRRSAAGDELVFSVPRAGVNESQIDEMKNAARGMGRGSIYIEPAGAQTGWGFNGTGDAKIPTAHKDFATANDIEPMLREIGAHPDQQAAVKTASDATGYAAVPPDAFFMFASPTEQKLQAGGFQPGQWNMEEIRPNDKLQQSAQRYAKATGMPEINHAPVEQDLDHARAVAQQYHDAEHAPNDPKVKAAYDALKQETKAQFYHLRDDLGLKFEPQEQDPYPSAQAMMHDVRQNNRLKVFSGSGPSADHPLSEVDPDTGQTYNTLFRWVHDAYGHAAGGNDFSENGEKSATEAHAQMYSPAARPAMRAETEGQTSWFFHNPDVESGAKQPGEFAPQKATLINEPGAAPAKTAAPTAIPAGSKFVPMSPEDYRAELDRSPRAKDFLQDSAEQLRDNKLFKLQTPEGKDTGIAYSIAPTGELRGLVNNGPYSGASEMAIKDAFSQGATHTQHSWDLNGRIANLYRKIGGGTVTSEPYDEATYGPPSAEMKDAWKKAGWKEGEPYPRYTQYVANGVEPSKTLSARRTWHNTAGDLAAKQDAGGIDPRTGKTDSEGHGVEIYPELRQQLGHAPTAKDFKAFYDQHKAIFDQNPELRVGWDNNSGGPGGHEINVGAVGKGAAQVARKLDQIAAFDIKKGENIPTGGKGVRTQFPNYSLDERMKDLRGETASERPHFEHLSPEVYDALEPDERKYMEGDKGLQQRVMSQYHRIEPSLEETSNAMQAGAALGGWWQRYMDIFHALAPETGERDAQTIGPSHAETLKQWHAALSANKSVQDANNLAWHTYADWLDAGKPTDRTTLNDILAQNGAQPEGSEKKGNAAMSDTLGPKGQVLKEGTDTSKLFNLVNSPEMKGERSFTGDVFLDDERKNPLMGKGEGYRKVPSMGATVAGKGNLNRIVLDTHMRDFYGQPAKGPVAQYIADSVHLRQAAQALGLKGGEGQEQLWGTVLGLKTLLKEGLTPEEAAGTLDAQTIRDIGKDYAEVIINDPEITKPGGVLDRLFQAHGVGRGAAGVSDAYREALSTRAGEGGPEQRPTPVNPSQLETTAERIRSGISSGKIKKQAPQRGLPLRGDVAPAGKASAIDFLNALGGLGKSRP